MFEAKLMKNIRYRLKRYGQFNLYSIQSTLYAEPKNEEADVAGACEECKHIFGIVSVCRAMPCEKDMDAIYETAERYLGVTLDRAKTFKVATKRSDKRFQFNSMQISAEIGGRLSDAHPHLVCDVNTPEVLVNIEVRDRSAYVHGVGEPGAGGMPVGVNGNGLLLLSGGIDSPVAGYMMAKRGLSLDAVHFFSYPYTSEQAYQKVMDLAKLMTAYTGTMTVHTVPFTKVQEEIRDRCPEEMFTIVMRRMMMRIATRVAKSVDAGALVTGESLGQVASQTMEAMRATEEVAGLPVFRPLIGMDKEEICVISRKIGTFETSILPYEDCCTVFTPKHPRTKPKLEEAEAAEANLDIEALVDEAIAGIERVKIHL